MAGKRYPMDRSYVVNNLKILTLMGLWNPYSGTKKWLYHIYTILIPLLLMPIRSVGFVKEGVIMHHDFMRSTLSLVVGLAYVYSWVKCVNFIWNRSNIELLIDTLNEERRLPCSKETGKLLSRYVTVLLVEIKNSREIDTLQASNTFDFECGPIYSQKWNVTTVGELIFCVRHYQYIVRMVKITNKVYGPILLPQLMTSLITISFAAIHIFVTKTVNFDEPGAALFAIAVTISCLFQLSAYCWGGDGIIIESNRTSTALYTCIWYEQDAKFQANLKIFFAMCRNTLIVSAFGLFDLSLVTLKNSASYKDEETNQYKFLIIKKQKKKSVKESEKFMMCKVCTQVQPTH
ncbi:uncharacterized protein LOC114841179 [Diachasma alloeum]|uniref:uncharacterized protein LOC114841179 n=1 Tax=Diachasma alloeum TaxID=454923 RepID=UPI0010FBB8C5|nr:uncharacterized protein LOC114841179 [Diachasma alloeum]